MVNIYKIGSEQLTIETDIPLLSLRELEIKQAGNEHGSLNICAMVSENKREEILGRDWSGTGIVVSQKEERLFCGKIAALVCTKENGYLTVQIKGIGATITMDREKRERSFQNPELTYGQVIEEVLKDYGDAAFIWETGEDRKIGVPLIQYEETDWEFLVRLCSHFHNWLTEEAATGKANFYFGMKTGKERNLNNSEISEIGLDDIYYRNGCSENGLTRKHAFYLIIKSEENWQIGDSVSYEGQVYRVCQKEAAYRKGEFTFTYRLGGRGLYYQKEKYNSALAGLRLEGTVRRTQEESVYIQLDIDTEEKADYAWDWAPETNNLSYCMPETDTKVTLYFATQEEKSGHAILAAVKNQKNSIYTSTQNRELATAYDKKIGLYPDRLFIQGKDNNVTAVMEDCSGIQLHSSHKVSLLADGFVRITGRNVTVSAPLETCCKAKGSNMELCRDINLYAVSGVNTEAKESPQGTGNDAGFRKKREPVESWRSAYSAIAAIPAIDLTENTGPDMAVDLYTCGCIPKVANGSTTIAMAEVMKGTKESKCSFPKAFLSMQNYMIKGGYALPEE